LEDRHRSADRIALALDFPSGSAFRNTCQRYLQATPLDIRARGGAAYVIRTLLGKVGAPERALALFDQTVDDRDDETWQIPEPETRSVDPTRRVSQHEELLTGALIGAE
jgi:hypothetical protein